MLNDDEFQIRPGKGRRKGAGQGRKAATLVGQVMQLAQRSGMGIRQSGVYRGGGTGASASGRQAALVARRYPQRTTNPMLARSACRIETQTGG